VGKNQSFNRNTTRIQRFLIQEAGKDPGPKENKESKVANDQTVSKKHGGKRRSVGGTNRKKKKRGKNQEKKNNGEKKRSKLFGSSPAGGYNQVLRRGGRQQGGTRTEGFAQEISSDKARSYHFKTKDRTPGRGSRERRTALRT